MKKIFQSSNRVYCLTNIFICLLCTGYLCTGYCSINNEEQQDANTIVVTEKEEEPLSEQSDQNNKKENTTVVNNSQKVVTAKKKTNTSNKKYVKPSYDSVTGSAVADYAKKYLGLRYVSGGYSLTTGTDCSGFTKLIYREFGITLSRSVKAQVNNGKYVKKSDLQKGDLVFYGSKSSSVSHVAIYIGGGKVIHQSNPRDGVKIDPVNMMVYITARRVITKPAQTTPNQKDENSNVDNNVNQNENVNNNTSDNTNSENSGVVDNNTNNNTNIENNNTVDNNTNNENKQPTQTPTYTSSAYKTN